ncbi:MAG: glycoside hydrolase family 3 N-terminal domain-containing protein [Bacteroidota bacterium]
MIKKIFRNIARLILVLGALLLVAFISLHFYYTVINFKAKKQLSEVNLLEENGFRFRDLNKNGKLDIYEDSRRSIDERVEDLLGQMTVKEKVGMMWHPPIGVGQKGEVLGKPNPSAMSLVSTWDVIGNKKINHFNLFTIPDSENVARWYNEVQEIAAQTRLGIPLTISSDPRHGINNFIGSDLLGSDFSKWPEPVGLAATFDSSLVAEFGRIANQEYRAVGIRTALHPMADLATEPRWARVNGTFGEDAHLAAKLTAAYIYGFQGEKFGAESVACMTKHWPGGGPQKDGEDAHFGYGADQAYPGNNFDYHLIPFEAALKAGTAMIMPYYGVPTGQTNEDVGMSFNREIISGLLREEYGFDGIVCTDWSIIEGFKIFGFELVEAKSWGVEDLTIKKRIKKAIDAGVDQFGGNMNTKELVELVEDDIVSEARLDESVARLLHAKFKMGLFDNPFVDVEKAKQTVGNPEFVEKGKLAQRKSIVLLKNEMTTDSTFVLPLKKNPKIFIENIERETAEKYAAVVDSLHKADFAVLRLQAPWEPRSGDIVENLFHQGALDFKEPELTRILDIMKQKPAVVCIYLDRPAVIPEIAENAAALLCDFGAYDDALLDVVFGEFIPEGRLPFELPSSMSAVKNQKEDVPYDSEQPLFEFGFGLNY